MGTPARGPMATEEQDEMKISSPHHQHPNLKNQADIVGHSRRHPTSIRNPRKEALPSQEEPVVTKMVKELQQQLQQKWSQSSRQETGSSDPGEPKASGYGAKVRGCRYWALKILEIY